MAAYPSQDCLDFYRRPDPMADAGGATAQLTALPDDVAALARVVQGVLLHEHVGPSYGLAIAQSRKAGSHVRSVARILDQILADGAPDLATPRSLETRFVCVCRSFALLLVAILRAKGVPARARCGFGAYFEPGRFVDHWVCEMWAGKEGRWRMIDAQLDEHQRRLFKLDFDPLDMPPQRFLVAGDAWAKCRAGQADPAAFGIMDMSGLWFIAGNLLRDLAALNNMPMLAWDVWGAMAGPGDDMDAERLALFDRIAAMTLEPGAHFAEIRRLYEEDDRLRVPATVLNAVLNRPEKLERVA